MTSAEKAVAYSISRTSPTCRPKATSGVPKISVASTACLAASEWRVAYSRLATT